LACHLQIDADPVPDPAYHFDTDLEPDFYLMRMRIQITKMMRIHNPDLNSTGKMLSSLRNLAAFPYSNIKYRQFFPLSFQQ
jgi:hypothetical protein